MIRIPSAARFYFWPVIFYGTGTAIGLRVALDVIDRGTPTLYGIVVGAIEGAVVTWLIFWLGYWVCGLFDSERPKVRGVFDPEPPKVASRSWSSYLPGLVFGMSWLFFWIVMALAEASAVAIVVGVLAMVLSGDYLIDRTTRSPQAAMPVSSSTRQREI